MMTIFFIFSNSISQPCHLVALIVLSGITYVSTNSTPSWVLSLLILLANDIEKNPGPHAGFKNNFFTFMNWNCNSIVKDNFARLKHIEAHNSLHNYDIISLCETSLTNETAADIPELEGYSFVPSNHQDNVARGGVGIFYKNSLPVVVRRDLSFNESLVLELKFHRKKVFFTVIYRSPSAKHNSPEFIDFTNNFKNLYTKLTNENPYATFFSGDLNGHSEFWWPSGDTTAEGRELEELLSSLNLSQIISEPTNFTPNKNPSCIDLIITDQPNLVLDSGTRPSLDDKCHHQITHCKVNFRIPPPPPCERRIWHYHRANTEAIQKSLNNFPWVQHLNLNNDVDWQVKSFTEIFLNIMSNFIPNELKKIVPRDPPWINKALKTKLKRKNRFFKNYKKHGYKPEDKTQLDSFRVECQTAIEEAKNNYLNSLGSKLNDSYTSQKSYWKIINKVMNKCRAPNIPPILVNNKFILDCKEKAKVFIKFFSNQCKPIANDSILPVFQYVTDKRINNIKIISDEILNLIRKLNPKKACGPDQISGHMLRISDKSVVLPLKLIFFNILKTSKYPALWKLANVTPIHKKMISN